MINDFSVPPQKTSWSPLARISLYTFFVFNNTHIKINSSFINLQFVVLIKIRFFTKDLYIFDITQVASPEGEQLKAK